MLICILEFDSSASVPETNILCGMACWMTRLCGMSKKAEWLEEMDYTEKCTLFGANQFAKAVSTKPSKRQEVWHFRRILLARHWRDSWPAAKREFKSWQYNWVGVFSFSFFLSPFFPFFLSFFHDQTYTLAQTRGMRRDTERPKKDRERLAASLDFCLSRGVHLVSNMIL